MKLGFKDQLIFPKPTPSKLLIDHAYLYNLGKLLKSMLYPWVDSLWVSSPNDYNTLIIRQIVSSSSSLVSMFSHFISLLSLSLFSLSFPHSMFKWVSDCDLYFVSTII